MIEVAAFAVLAVFAATLPRPRPAGPPARGPLLARLQAGIPGPPAGSPAVSVVALVLLGVAVAGAGAPGHGQPREAGSRPSRSGG